MESGCGLGRGGGLRKEKERKKTVRKGNGWGGEFLGGLGFWLREGKGFEEEEQKIFLMFGKERGGKGEEGTPTSMRNTKRLRTPYPYFYLSKN